MAIGEDSRVGRLMSGWRQMSCADSVSASGIPFPTVPGPNSSGWAAWKMRAPRLALAIASAVSQLVDPAAAAVIGGYAEVVRQAAPSVVTVLVEEQGESAGQRAVERATADAHYNDMRVFMRRMLSGLGSDNPVSGETSAALGSGFIIRADGLIVTNRHVVESARTVRVKLTDGRVIPAQVLGTDATTDIALLRVRAGPLPALRLDSSDRISVGDPVIAIGNPFGLGQSVTAGILSARARALEEDPYIDFLQTDAAINFGNSGGPLLSTDGAVIGVTTAILSPSGGSVGLGFAIPAETVASVVAELEAHGRVSRGYLGISVQAMTPALARALMGQDTPVGALITAAEPQGPSADRLQAGDVLLSIGTTPVTFDGLGKVTVRLTPGTTIEASLVRSGVKQSIVLTVGQLPDPPANPLHGGGRDTWVPNLELGVANATTEIRTALKAQGEVSGLIVTQLRPNGAGALAGLKIGDLITHAGSKRLQGVADLAGVDSPSRKFPLLLRVIRDGSPGFIAVTGSEEQ
jgi:serine protease Do